MRQLIDNRDYNNNFVLYLVFIFIILIIFVLILLGSNGNKIENEYGTWLCSGTYNVKLELSFDRNGDFIYNASNESDSIYVNGSYSLEKFNKNNNDDYKYYRYTLYPYKIIWNELEETEYKPSQFEIAISSDGKNSIVSSANNKERYSCRRK